MTRPPRSVLPKALRRLRCVLFGHRWLITYAAGSRTAVCTRCIKTVVTP